jgi:hypothetical protein
VEKRIFNYFNLRWKPILPIMVVGFLFVILLTVGYEYFFETFELRDLGSLLFLEVFFLIAFIFDYNKKVIFTNEGITIHPVWAKEQFFAWDDIKSIGTFKYDNWGKVQPAPEKEGRTAAMFISKTAFEKLSHTFLNKPNQTLKLPFNTELYSLVKQKIA